MNQTLIAITTDPRRAEHARELQTRERLWSAARPRRNAVPRVTGGETQTHIIR